MHSKWIDASFTGINHHMGRVGDKIYKVNFCQDLILCVFNQK